MQHLSQGQKHNMITPFIYFGQNWCHESESWSNPDRYILMLQVFQPCSLKNKVIQNQQYLQRIQCSPWSWLKVNIQQLSLSSWIYIPDTSPLWRPEFVTNEFLKDFVALFKIFHLFLSSALIQSLGTGIKADKNHNATVGTREGEKERDHNGQIGVHFIFRK